MKKVSFAGLQWGVLSLLLVVSGCQKSDTSLGGLISPKREVPPVEQMRVEEVPEEESAALLPGTSSSAVEAGAGLYSGEEEVEQYTLPEPEVFTGITGRKYVSARMSFYRRELSKWQGLADSFSMFDIALPQPQKWQDCFDRLNEMEDGYNTLQARLFSSYGHPSEELAGPLFAVCRHDISFLESDCRHVFAVSVSVIPDELRKYREIIADQAEGVVRYWAERDDEEKIVASYENLIMVTDGGPGSLQVRELYARALRSLGRLEESARTLLQVADEKNDLQGWPLRLQAAEILFAKGDFAEAGKQYQKTADLFSALQRADAKVQVGLELLAGEKEHGRELELYRLALLGWLNFDGRTVPPQLAESVIRLEENFAGSRYAVLARELFNRAGGSVQRYVHQELQRASQLASENNFAQALDILAILPQSTDSEELLALINEAEAEMREQQKQQLEMAEIEKGQAMEAKWHEGLEHFDHRRYDEAIAAFDELIDSPYRDQAMAKLTEAVNLAASELRKEAAALFVKSRKVQHPQQKSELLLESRRLLVMVQEKYPGAQIIGKVKQNLRVIEEQIRSLDTSLPE